MSFSFDVFDPPMSLVMGFKRTDSGEDSKGRMLTLDRAIIVRVPEEVFDDPNAVMKSEDPARLLSLLDAGGGELNVVTLFGSGNAVYGSNGLSEVTLDLQSECPVPLYRGYIKQMVGFGVRDAHFGECLEEKMPEGPATIRGKFHGQWVRDWKPPI